MNVGVIGSGSIGPDLAYGFVSAIAGQGGRVHLLDIKKEALDIANAFDRGGLYTPPTQRGIQHAPRDAGIPGGGQPPRQHRCRRALCRGRPPPTHPPRPPRIHPRRRLQAQVVLRLLPQVHPPLYRPILLLLHRFPA